MVDEVDDKRHEVELEKEDGEREKIMCIMGKIPTTPMAMVSAKRWLLRGLTSYKLQP